MERFNYMITPGGGVRHTNRRTINSTALGITQAWEPDYTYVDADIRYARDGRWSLKLNINNLTDEIYYELAQFLGGRPGKPLDASLSFTRKS